MMDRRALLQMCLGVFAAPLDVGAQQVVGKGYRIGFLGNSNPEQNRASLVAFQEGLRDLGWVEGQNISVVYRWADGDLSRLPALAADLVKLKVDVIVTAGGPTIQVVRRATPTIPIVAAIMANPVTAGFAASLARPGGNITGQTIQFEELVSKQIQILKEATPRAARLAILDHSSNTLAVPAVSVTRKAAEAAASALALNARVFEVTEVTDLVRAFRVAKAEHQADAMQVLPSPFFHRHRVRLVELAVQHRLPAVYEAPEYVEAGGLMSYGPSFSEMFRRAAGYVDKILNGVKPADLPIEQPTRFELVINVKTATALGLTIPPSVLARANRVIE